MKLKAPCNLPQSLSLAIFDRLPLLFVDESGNLQVKKDALSCCQGSGLALDSCGTVHRCDLRQRFQRTDTLFHKIYQGFDERSQELFLQPFDRSMVQQFLEWFKNQNKELKSWLLDLSRPEMASRLLADLALLATWQLGLKVLYIDFRKAESWQLIQDDLHREEFDLIILDHISKLWMPDSLLNLELLVSYVSAVNSPSVLGFVNNKAAAIDTKAARPKISDRVKALQSRPWQQCLSPYLREHLSMMSGKRI